jgi:hypothetical protein
MQHELVNPFEPPRGTDDKVSADKSTPEHAGYYSVYAAAALTAGSVLLFVPLIWGERIYGGRMALACLPVVFVGLMIYGLLCAVRGIVYGGARSRRLGYLMLLVYLAFFYKYFAHVL